jgi:hypothetical protein
MRSLAHPKLPQGKKIFARVHRPTHRHSDLTQHRHSDRSGPTFSFAFAPANASGRVVEESLFDSTAAPAVPFSTKISSAALCRQRGSR